MTEDASGSGPDDQTDGADGESETPGPPDSDPRSKGSPAGESDAPEQLDGSSSESDPFDETFIVKETEPTDTPFGDDPSRIEESSSSQMSDRSEDEWDRIPIDLTSDEDDTAVDASDPDADDPYAPEPSSAPVVPGNPSLEGALFVLLGAISMVLVLIRLVSVTLA